MTATIKNISGLECVASESGRDTAVVMLHGYGASMRDLYPLMELWDNGEMDWYFPNGVMSLPMGYYEGRAWFSIDVAAFEEAQREGRPRDLRDHIPPEFDDNLKHLENFLREIAKTHKKIILGGFSQGAMCAVHLGMIQDLPVSALILLSGNLIADSRLPKASRGLPFFQSHGTMDPILGSEGAEFLEKRLLGLGFQGKLLPFRGGHEIPANVISGVKAFISMNA